MNRLFRLVAACVVCSVAACGGSDDDDDTAATAGGSSPAASTPDGSTPDGSAPAGTTPAGDPDATLRYGAANIPSRLDPHRSSNGYDQNYLAPVFERLDRAQMPRALQGAPLRLLCCGGLAMVLQPLALL